MKTTYFSSLFLVITSGSSEFNIFRIPSSLSNAGINFMQKVGKRSVYPSGAGTSRICQFKMPGKRPMGSAASCIQQKAVTAVSLGDCPSEEPLVITFS